MTPSILAYWLVWPSMQLLTILAAQLPAHDVVTWGLTAVSLFCELLCLAICLFCVA